MKKRWITLLFIMCMGMSTLAYPCAAFGNTTVSWKTAITRTEIYIGENIDNPQQGYEWTVMALARDGGAVKYGTYSDYYESMVSEVKACKGVLDTKKALPYTKVIMALKAIGKNPKNVGGYNLLKGLADYDKVMASGINGPIWTLLALDCGNYSVPTVDAGKTQTTRNKLIEAITERELDGGGFTVGMSTNGAETDITAMAIQALAPYRERADVKEVIDRALLVLSEKQGKDGMFSDYGSKSSESIAQVILALTALDIHPAKDSRFVKQGNTLVDALLQFYVSGGGFRHVMKTTAGYTAPVNGMATEQAYMALGAYKRYLNHDNFVYDMSDGMPVYRPVGVKQKALAKGLKQVTVRWQKVSGAKGYQIRYATDKGFSSYKTVNVSAKALSKTIKNLSTTKTYYFKVRAYKLDKENKRVYGRFSGYRYMKPNGKVTNVVCKSPKRKQINLSWNKVSGAKGYQICYASKSSFQNSRSVYVSSKCNAKILTKLMSGKRYYVKIRAYTKTDSGKKIYGAYSTIKSLSVK